MGTGGSLAETGESRSFVPTPFGYSNSFIFVENGISFAVYPDGEFDFFIQHPTGLTAAFPLGTAAVTFNAGFNYNPYVQYDDFGAVIQVQQVPVFYDYYGRVRRIGNVHLSYWNGRLHRLGGMRVYYNSLGYYDYHVGYINPFNRVYVYQPFHRFFVRPAAGFCMVYPQPYRRYYSPVRYTYYRPYHNNIRRAYAKVGTPHRYRQQSDRHRIYRNDHRAVANTEPGSRGTTGRTSARVAETSRREGQAMTRSSQRSSATTRAGKSPGTDRGNAYRNSPDRNGRHSLAASGRTSRSAETRVQTVKRETRASGRQHPGTVKTPARADAQKRIASQGKGIARAERSGAATRTVQKGRSGSGKRDLR